MPTIHLLSIDSALADRLGEAMGERVTVEMVQSLEAADLSSPGIIVIDHAAIPADRSLPSAIASVADGAQGRAIVIATDEINASQVLVAIRAGATDVISRKAPDGEIAAIFSRLLNNAIVTQGLPGRLTLVLGADREVTAILATDMALSLSLGQAPTLLVDCTLPTSTAEAYLDLKTDYGIASAVADLERLDTSLLADALTRHEPSGLSLLTLDGGTGSEPVGLSPNDIVRLIQLLRVCYGHVVLSTGSLRNGGLLRELASQAQHVEVVCSQSIRELDACRRLLERIAPDTASAARMRLLVWDHDPEILLDGRRMADVLGIESVMTVPTDRVETRNALNAGRPLALQRTASSYMQAVRRAIGIAEPEAGMRPTLDKLRRALLRSTDKAA